MKSLLKISKVLSIILITLSLITTNIIPVFATQSNQLKPLTYNQYGIVEGNGITSTIYLKVGTQCKNIQWSVIMRVMKQC